uniref:GH18 domain-containing protein n=1 Tax=Panagrolaimus sp. JU765 TaxID=591449 RepID=A0AC34QV38_9BILA
MSSIKLLLFIVIDFILKPTQCFILTCYAPMNSPGAEKIDPNLCTHLLLIGGTFVDTDGLILLPKSIEVQPFVKLKEKNSNLKILMTLTPNNRIMSQIVLDDGLMEQMANTLVYYMINNNLDGFDIDWEFPVWSSDAKKTDKKGLSTFLSCLRNKFDGAHKNLLLFLTVGAPYTIAKKGYDISAINKYVDYLQIMTYDFHDVSHLEPITGFNAPLRAASYEYLILAKMNSDYSVRYWLRMGLQRNKTVFGVPTYGKGFRLLSKYLHYPYAPAVGPSKYGNTLGYTTVCNLTNQGYTYHWNSAAATPYWVNGYQWLSAENPRSVQEKTNYAKQMNLAGVMIFGLHADDYDSNCGGERYPLTTAIHKQLYN